MLMEQEQEISFRERIRLNLLSAMKAANFTQVKLADELGISKGTVNNWIRGNNSPDVDMVPRICRALDISISSLYAPVSIEKSGVEQKKSSPSAEEGELDAQEKQVMSLVKRLTPDQKNFLLAVLKILLGPRR